MTRPVQTQMNTTRGDPTGNFDKLVIVISTYTS